jgi:hypothetical protein
VVTGVVATVVVVVVLAVVTAGDVAEGDFLPERSDEMRVRVDGPTIPVPLVRPEGVRMSLL